MRAEKESGTYAVGDFMQAAPCPDALPAPGLLLGISSSQPAVPPLSTSTPAAAAIPNSTTMPTLLDVHSAPRELPALLAEVLLCELPIHHK